MSTSSTVNPEPNLLVFSLISFPDNHHVIFPHSLSGTIKMNPTQVPSVSRTPNSHIHRSVFRSSSTSKNSVLLSSVNLLHAAFPSSVYFSKKKDISTFCVKSMFCFHSVSHKPSSSCDNRVMQKSRTDQTHDAYAFGMTTFLVKHQELQLKIIYEDLQNSPEYRCF